MKKFFALLLICTLVLTAGCSGAAVQSDVTSEAIVTEAAVNELEEMQSDSGTAKTRPADHSKRDDKDGVLGKIAAVSESGITFAVGTITRPDGISESRRDSAADGSRPEGEFSMSERQGDSFGQKGERPAGRGAGGFGSGFPGGIPDLEYTGEEVSYVISDSVAITKGMGENSATLSLSDLAEGDIVRLVLDESGQPVSIQVFAMSEAGNSSKSQA